MSSHDVNWSIISEIEDLQALWEKWDTLLANTPLDQLFNSSDWLINWIASYWEQHWQLSVHTAWSNKELVAIIPLYHQSDTTERKSAVSYPLGQGEPEHMEVASEYLDIIVSPTWYSVLKEDIYRRIQRNSNVLKWRAAMKGAYILDLLQGTEHISSPATRYLTENKKFELSMLSKNTRAQHNRALNKLKKNYQYSFRWVAPDEAFTIFDILSELHTQRWQSIGKTGAFTDNAFLTFHRQFIQHRHCAFSVLEVEGKIIAINYYFTKKGILYFYQSGWNNKDFQHLSPGLLLHCWSIKNTEHETYDFMMGAAKHSYKSKLSTSMLPMVSIEAALSMPYTLKFKFKKTAKKARHYLQQFMR
ncbi:GNAT family N-acetyltransferase [Alteromonas halophila]|uniref:BioF2-like acetyltransferase domain-containing protein n=1 Tax=Alteromonas halophila TaxID=516698 RepID=A0A918MYX8_9ALTE|nr:GNAT family N-acetyltransferase [Alteromonas halophila]GGW86943.1 hypothetical protein GCM10007391_20910 [Alteromonas halophila]